MAPGSIVMDTGGSKMFPKRSLVFPIESSMRGWEMTKIHTIQWTHRPPDSIHRVNGLWGAEHGIQVDMFG